MSAEMQLANRDTNNAVSLYDAIEHGLTVAKLPEDGVPAIEVRLRRVRHEELAPTGIGAGERHPEGASPVAVWIELVPNGIPRSAVPVPPWVTGLHHEVRHDAVEALSIEIASSGQADEVVDGHRGVAGKEHELHRSAL